MSFERIKGLNEEEVKINREKYGSNSITTEKKNRILLLIKEIVSEPLFIILICSTIIYFILGEGNEAIIMLVALSFVSGISLYQENKSRSAVDALKKLSSPLTKVIRNGELVKIPAEELVMNDVIVVEDGDIVPADSFVIESHDFSINESILTGESMPVVKSSIDSNNRIYQGTMIMTGSAKARVFAIGSLTEFGKISHSLDEIVIPKTPLQQQIKKFVRSMVGAGSIAFFIVWGINYYLSKDILHGLLHGLTLAMSVLPEEIPVAFSTFMAMGAYHLYKKKVIARSPHTVETLGAATVICVDKTGTITENEMHISAIYDFTNKLSYDFTKEKFTYNIVLEYAMWASEITPFDAMEKSIHEIYSVVAPDDKRQLFSMINEYPLSGNPPFMTHVFTDKKTTNYIAAKGSVEGILNQSKLSNEEINQILKKALSFTSKGYRVLAVAKSNSDLNNLPSSQTEFDFDFIGLIAFYDPPKKNIPNILDQFYKAGISVKMITGDHSDTAIAIANQIHLKNSSRVLTGKEVMEMPNKSLCDIVNQVNIFARMFPDAKLKVIEALKSNGEIVAMTGDGVNDGPALKAAHIGIAMGMRGSEIAKKAASLILMDDDLSHMVDAVALGRRIYENLKKAIQYIISIHIPIILIVTLPLLLFWKFTDFFSPIHVIFLELIMGPTCSIIFENEPIEADSMSKKPRKMSSTFFSFRELSLSILQGIVITIFCLGLGYYFMQNESDQTHVRTIIYTTLIFSNLFLTLANRSFYYSVITTLKYKNILIPIILAISLMVLFLSIYLHPIRNIFQFAELSFQDIIICLLASFVSVMWIEILKYFKRKNMQ